MKKIFILLLVLFLGGCSTKFAYNNISWLVYWYLDDYIELTNEQEDEFDDMLASWMTWHKSEELPRYEAQLQDIINDVKANALDAQKISAHRERARGHWIRARTHVANDIVQLATSLSDSQIDYFFRQLEEENQEDEEEMLERSELDADERIEKWNKRNQKNLRKWIGRLNNAQKAHVAEFYNKFESTGEHWLAYKREYQGQLKAVFEQDNRGDTFKQQLYDLIVEPEQFRSAQFQEAIDANARAGDDFLIGLLALSSDKQIIKLIDEIGDYKEDAISLQKK